MKGSQVFSNKNRVRGRVGVVVVVGMYVWYYSRKDEMTLNMINLSMMHRLDSIHTIMIHPTELNEHFIITMMALQA